ncbi:MAG: alanine--glyoxylate aminotransferase family protein [Candidatus Abyssobacteria bacterium SURF_5]|uniref:Alanine--glyoxylate aminotransferase family protein n=1 Tax=Abyssobacteria bacterium (strain SURF_5) TaxID=2093360 RepID=A0A3A4NYV2_ABYX5|nr:MAG: alanine--glyoxylate aminotransferase family protein [Candidatus Abyssubacteria bacterium SURF_5]
MKKKLLMTPGPTSTPSEVLLAMAKPIIHHRTEEFKAILKETNEGLQYLFQTKNPVVMFSASGTGAMEAAVVNLLSRNDLALVVRGGKFGERWGEICEAYGMKPLYIDVEWGHAVDPVAIQSALKEHPEIKAVFTTLCETSTCVRNDIEAIGKTVADTAAVLVVDAISGLCADDLKTDEWSVDVAVSGSQKGIMLPPGLSFASISPKAQQLIVNSNLPKFYLSFQKALKSLAKTDTPFTSAVSLIYGLREAIRMIRAEGIAEVIRRHSRLARATREAAEALDLSLFSKAPSNVATAVQMPGGIDADVLRKKLTGAFGISFAGGQDKLKGNIIRVAHLGYCAESDVLTAVSALEIVLNKMGYSAKPGTAAAAAERVFTQQL